MTPDHNESSVLYMETTTAHNANYLASMADCASPDSSESAGAGFLLSVQDAYLSARDDDHAFDDADAVEVVSELADSLVPVYTHEIWSVFVDLAAYNVDLSDYGTDACDCMEHQAMVALYAIAEALVWALFEEDAEA